MDEVRVLKSLVSPDTLRDQVCTLYDLPDPITCTVIRQGDNDNYLLQAADRKFVLRVYRHNKHWLAGESDYLFELDWLAYLREQRLPVSAPVSQMDGRFLNSIAAPEGQRYWALFEYAEGRMELDVPRGRIFGSSVAQIHIASNGFSSRHHRFTADLEWIVDKPLRRLIDFLGPHQPDIVEGTTSIAEEAKSRLKTQDLEGDCFGIIGGDFHGFNHHFTKDSRVTHFDFDLCSYGWRAYDIAIFRWARGSSNSLWNEFLDGYESVRPLSETERESIPTFVVLRQIWLMGSHTTYPESPGWIGSDHWGRLYNELQKYVSGEFVED